MPQLLFCFSNFADILNRYRQFFVHDYFENCKHSFGAGEKLLELSLFLTSLKSYVSHCYFSFGSRN